MDAKQIYLSKRAEALSAYRDAAIELSRAAAALSNLVLDTLAAMDALENEEDNGYCHADNLKDVAKAAKPVIDKANANVTRAYIKAIIANDARYDSKGNRVTDD